MQSGEESKLPKSFQEIADNADLKKHFTKFREGAIKFGKNLEDYKNALEAHSFALIEKCSSRVYDSMQKDFLKNFECLQSLNKFGKTGDKELQKLCNDFFGFLKLFCKEIKKLNSDIFFFPLKFKSLDDINEKYDAKTYDELKKQYRLVYMQWDNVFRNWNQNYVKKLTDIVSKISDLDIGNIKSFGNSLTQIIVLQVKFQQSIGSIILQTSNWLESINPQIKKQSKSSFIKRLSKLKRIIFRKKAVSDFKNFKVFPSGKPSPDDVRQVVIADCYLMSVLIALAKNNPEAIRKCFLQSDEEIEKARIIKVRLHTVILKNDDESPVNNDNVKSQLTVTKDGSKGFYYKFKYEPAKPYIIDVKREDLRVRGLSKTKALWPLIIQDAYAQFRKKYYETLVIDSDEATIKLAKAVGKSEDVKKILSMGYDSLAYVIITGKPSKETYHTDSGRLIKELQKGTNTSSTCTFLKKSFIKDAETGKRVRLHTSHTYAITNVDVNKKIITIQDPNRLWGVEGQEGRFTMRFSDFDKYVESISFSRK